MPKLFTKHPGVAHSVCFQSLDVISNAANILVHKSFEINLRLFLSFSLGWIPTSGIAELKVKHILEAFDPSATRPSRQMPASTPPSSAGEGHFPAEALAAISSFKIWRVEKWKCVFVLIYIALMAGEMRHFLYFGALLKSSLWVASLSPCLLWSHPAYVSPSLVFKDGVGGEDGHVSMWEYG